MNNFLTTGDGEIAHVRLQAVGFVEAVADTVWDYPVLFKCISTASGNVEVIAWDDTQKIVDCQELNNINMLIKKIVAGAGTTVTLADLLLTK